MISRESEFSFYLEDVKVAHHHLMRGLNARLFSSAVSLLLVVFANNTMLLAWPLALDELSRNDLFLYSCAIAALTCVCVVDPLFSSSKWNFKEPHHHVHARMHTLSTAACPQGAEMSDDIMSLHWTPESRAAAGLPVIDSASPAHRPQRAAQDFSVMLMSLSPAGC